MNGEHGIADDLDVQAATPSALRGSFDPQDFYRGFGLDEITPENMQSRPYVPSVFCGDALGPSVHSATVVGAMAGVAANLFAAPIVERGGLSAPASSARLFIGIARR